MKLHLQNVSVKTNKIIENFEEQRVFISNIREKSSGQDGLVNLQKTFITELFRSAPEIEDVNEKKILAVLVDVDIVNTRLMCLSVKEDGNTVYSWWQYQFCDVFIEAIKPCFSGENLDRTHAQDTLWVCLETGLRLLHPFMPFVTEELWQRLPSPKGCEREASIMICEYPSPIEEWTDEKVEAEMEMVMATVKTIRRLRAAESMERQRNEKLHAFALCGNITTLEIMQSHELEIRTLASLSSFEVILKGEDRASQAGSAVVETVNENLKVYLKVDGAAIDPEAEREKMRRRLKRYKTKRRSWRRVWV
ncbi:hypothetical protein Bca52824_072554 [Brassica carinata]|uniref:valine--tRNA ligase n=1 Tax=Brassica carinata TaxID=52824 RepID=A0A8X7Q8B4_BRACI|nr:hypothetical protein Bca52824_072554 [Brassica carinata]